MKCTNCGTLIPEDKLYCEKCGEEVTIVPLFEPEVEIRLDESIHTISNELADDPDFNKSVTKKRKRHYLTLVLILVFLSLIAGGIGLKYLFDSPEYHINKGNRYLYAEDYKEAIKCYEKALSKIPENEVDIYLYLIKCYENLGYDGKYEEYLQLIIDNTHTNEVQLFTAYSKLIDLYREGKGYQKINKLLKSCTNDKIVNHFKEYLVSAPAFSHEDGTYREIIPLKMVSPDGDSIYFTTDGTIPTLDSEIYKEPIFLEDGAYHFTAVCIDEHGVYSDVVEKTYEVNFANK